MTIKPVLMLASLTVCLGVLGCASRPAWVRSSLAETTPEFQKEFKLVEMRCSQCHSLDKMRKLYRTSTTREDWELEVEDMAEREGSKIRESERKPLTDLLFAWSQGAGS